MQKTYLNMAPPQEAVFSIYASDILALGASATGFIPLLNIPANCVLLGYRIKGVTQFTWGGGGSGTLKVQLGFTDSTGVARTFGSLSADLIATAVTDIAPLTEGALFTLLQISAAGPNPAVLAATSIGINVTSSVSNLALVATGQVDIYIAYQSSMTQYPIVAFNPNN